MDFFSLLNLKETCYALSAVLLPSVFCIGSCACNNLES